MKPGAVGKAVGKELPNAAPVLLWVGVGWLVWKVIKKILDDLKRDPSITPTDEPILESRTGVLTASFVEPANNGAMKSAYIPLGDLKLKVAVNNPGGPRKIELKVEVTFYPRIFGGSSAAQASKQMLVPSGRSVQEVHVSRPFAGGSILSTIDAVGMIYVDGNAVGTAAFAVD